MSWVDKNAHQQHKTDHYPDSGGQFRKPVTFRYSASESHFMKSNATSVGILPFIARIALVISLIGSMAMVFSAGRGNRSTLLVVLFAGWVALPFVGLGFIDLLSSEWTPPARSTLFRLMLFVAVASLAIYVYVVRYPRPQEAFPFLVTPFSTWVLMAIVMLAFLWRSRRSS
jgi:hypothetical protein